MEENLINKTDTFNIIFLDVDGVLNSINNLIKVYEKTHKQHSGYNYPFDEECINNFRFLLEETNSKIVITSTWRRHEKSKKVLLEKLDEYGLKDKVIGYTPILNEKRGKEIKRFLDTLDYKPNFIILDDDIDMEDLIAFLINTNPYLGLTKEDTLKGIKILTKCL